jgi:membrane carboxypeptidase/penicillin-binding protein PbpC
MVYQAEPVAPVRVLDERVAWLISDMLSDDDARILSFGQDSILNIGRTAAVKTGTTNDFHDNWTVGYTPDVVVGVWVGNADNTPMFNVTGVSGAGPIWHMVMRSVLAGTPDRSFARPEGLNQMEVCRLSGLLPSPDCPFRHIEWFITGTEPQETDTFYEWVTLDKRNMLLATEETPEDQAIEQLALDLPPDLHPWARAAGLLLLDDLLVASAATQDGAGASLRLVSPDPNTKYRLTTAGPPEVQKLPVQVVGGAGLKTITVWLDDVPLETLAQPPYQTWWVLSPGVHTMWAEGKSEDGTLVVSEPIAFEVLAPIQHSR